MKTKWINVKDTLPEDNKNVLVYDTGDYYEAWYSHTSKHWHAVLDQIDVIEITHWMPLPKPPES